MSPAPPPRRRSWRRSARDFPKVPIIATGGPTEESILRTIQAGANAITYTPPSNGVLFARIMNQHRKAL